MNHVLLIGANGTIASALKQKLTTTTKLSVLSRDNCDYSEEALKTAAQNIKANGSLHQVYCCIGVLHSDLLSPEKRLGQLDALKLAEYFRINTILPALCLKHFAPLLDKQRVSQFVCLSAMVGSIGDNQLGGWYGYRASKAALNMMVKGAAIEINRNNKKAVIAAVHPGTTQGPLSAPYSGRVAREQYYTADQSAARIIDVTSQLTPEQSGGFFNWDGRQLTW